MLKNSITIIVSLLLFLSVMVGWVSADDYCGDGQSCPVGAVKTGTCLIGCNDDSGVCLDRLGTRTDTCDAISNAWSVAGTNYACGFRVDFTDSPWGTCGECERSTCTFTPLGSVTVTPGPADYWFDCCPGASGGGGGGGSTCSPLLAGGPDFDCDRYGLFGTYSVLGVPSSANRFTCGPTDYIPPIALQCGWWNASWDGYFVAPEAGDYQFLAKVNPSGQFMIDLNGDGNMACPATRVWGDRMMGIRGDAGTPCAPIGSGIAYRPKWAALLENGIDPNASCGWPGCNCTASDCDGMHCQDTDINTFGLPYGNNSNGQSQWWYWGAPTELTYPWVAGNYPGLLNSELPSGFPKIPPYTTWPAAQRSNSYGNGECIYNTPPNSTILYYDKAAAYVWVKRYLTAGNHKVYFSYDYNIGASADTSLHYMKFWYKGPNDSSFVLAQSQTGTAACPFRPCESACASTPPAAPVIQLPPDPNTYRLYDTTTQTISVSHDGDWGVACPTQINQIHLCVGTDQTTVDNFSGCDLLNEQIPGAAGASSYSRIVATNDNGAPIYIAARASNGSSFSPTVSRLFYEPADLTVNVAEGNSCSDNFGAITGWQATVNSSYLAPSRTNGTGLFPLLPSHTATTIQVLLPSDWVQTCGNPAITNLATDVAAQFRFTRRADAWFQIINGDVGVGYFGTFARNLEVAIPSSQTLLAQTSADSSGVALASGSIDVDGVVGPEHREWSAAGSTYTTPPQENYDYFFTLYEMGVPTDNFNRPPDQIAIVNWTETPEKISDDSSEEAYYREGDLIVDSSPPSGVKRTVFVEGDLTVGGDVVVPPGEFLAFIVSGDITFTSDVTQAQGVYIADGTITVDNMHQSVTTVALRQFRGEGIFVGWGGVNLGRDLDSGGTPADDLDNNTAAGETFTYRGDFLINAPAGLKRLGIAWKEVAPQGP